MCLKDCYVRNGDVNEGFQRDQLRQVACESEMVMNGKCGHLVRHDLAIVWGFEETSNNIMIFASRTGKCNTCVSRKIEIMCV